MKKLIAIMAILAFTAGSAMAHHGTGHGTGNNGNGVGNTGVGNQGNGPNSGTAGNAGGNHGGGNNGGSPSPTNPGGYSPVDVPAREGGNCRVNNCDMEQSDDVISRKVGPYIDKYLFRHLQDLFNSIF